MVSVLDPTASASFAIKEKSEPNKAEGDQEELDYDENLAEDEDAHHPLNLPLAQRLNEASVMKKSSSEDGDDEDGEIDDDDEEDESGSGEGGGGAKKDRARNDLEDGEVSSEEENQSPGRRTSPSKGGRGALFQKMLKEEEEAEDSGLLEEGEDDSGFGNDNNGICRYFARGNCYHGRNCRYVHETTGDMYEFVPHRPNRNILEPRRAPQRDRRPPPPPPQYLSDQEDERPNFINRAWADGLKDAKEMMKKSREKKETDMDFEQRKMLAGVESAEDMAGLGQDSDDIPGSGPSSAFKDKPPRESGTVKEPVAVVTPPAEETLSKANLFTSREKRKRSLSKDSDDGDDDGGKASGSEDLSPKKKRSRSVSRSLEKDFPQPAAEKPSRIAVPTSLGADKWEDPWQRSTNDRRGGVAGAGAGGGAAGGEGRTRRASSSSSSSSSNSSASSKRKRYRN